MGSSKSGAPEWSLARPMTYSAWQQVLQHSCAQHLSRNFVSFQEPNQPHLSAHLAPAEWELPALLPWVTTDCKRWVRDKQS